MIPGSKLTDIWGRKRCFIAGLTIYAAGGLLALASTGLTLLIIGYSLLEGVGSALMIPPIYILITVAFPDVKSRAKYFGVVSGSRRPRRGRRSPDRRPGHQRDQLAGIVRAAGPGRGLDSSPRPQDQRSRPDQVLRPVSTCPERSCRRPGCSSSFSGCFSPGPTASGSRGRTSRSTAQSSSRRARSPPSGSGGDRRALPAVVLPAYPGRRAQAQGCTAAAPAFPQQGLQSGSGNPAHPVADHAGLVLRRVRLPAGGRRLQRDQDGPDADPGYDRNSGRRPPAPTDLRGVTRKGR